MNQWKIVCSWYEESKGRNSRKVYFTTCSVHPCTTKMYHNIRDLYWWDGLKKDVADYDVKCLTCQQVKAEHQKPSRKLQPLPIPEWKWERITIDFVVRLPRSKDGYNSIWVIVDRLTKSAHFLSVKATYSVAKWCVKHIVCLYGVPISIVSDRGSIFTSRCWQKL